MTNQQKAKRSFNYAAKQASKCRHEKYIVSCFSCSEKNECGIQERIERAKIKM